MKKIQNIKDSIYKSIQAHEILLNSDDLIKEVNHVAELFVHGIGKRKKVIFFGNGGSAADAQHFAAEFVGRFVKKRESLPAIALTTDTSNITAIGNDFGFDQIFSRQIEGLGGKGDIAVGISTSGTSLNVIKGLESAIRKELITIGLTGKEGGEIKDIVDHCICVPTNKVSRIQELHLLIGHLWIEAVEEELFA